MVVGKTYRITRLDAKLSWQQPAPDGGWTYAYKVLNEGALVKHLSDGWGPGSDPGRVQLFEAEDGTRGEVMPAGVFGSFPQWLQEVDDKKVEALKRFRAARSAFFMAGNELCDAWNALAEFGSEVMLQNNRTSEGDLLLPLSLDEWLTEFDDALSVEENI